MRPNREMEAITRANRVASDVHDLLAIVDAARGLLLTMPRPDVSQDPKLAAVYNRLWGAIETFTQKTEPAKTGP